MSKYKNSAVSIYYQIEYLNQFSQPYQNTIVLVIKQLMPMEIGVNEEEVYMEIGILNPRKAA